MLIAGVACRLWCVVFCVSAWKRVRGAVRRRIGCRTQEPMYCGLLAGQVGSLLVVRDVVGKEQGVNGKVG